MAEPAPRPIVFFDGLCGLCNGLVDFALQEDPDHHLRFASLQGDAARGLLPPDVAASLDSIVLLADGKVHLRAAAVLRILASLGGPWRVLAAVARLVPMPVLDGLYAFIARRRYRWFGKRDRCRLPTPEERSYFLN
jgi:predicted DCC family thiol-disulfide oxidoreductase YuxK